MKARAKSSKGIDIYLQEEKFYFPGEIIKGHVIVHPKHPTKTNHIVVRFFGEVLLTLKDKETILLFQDTRILPVFHESGQSKAGVLTAKPHKFDFEFRIPSDLDLPSTMEIVKKVRVRYTLLAIHNRPMVPESLCARAECTVHVLEYLDIESERLARPQKRVERLLYSQIAREFHIEMSIPRTGFTRGDIVTTTITVSSFEPVLQKKAIAMHLVRIVELRTSGRTLTHQEDVLRSSTYNLDTRHTMPYAQHIVWKTPVPMSTSPTIKYSKGIILRVYYRVRLRIRSPDPEDAAAPLEIYLPITVGTWPRTAIPIDDDDDNGDTKGSEISQQTQHNSSSNTHERLPPSPITPSKGLRRSNSNASNSSRKSQESASSERSNHSWESPPSLSRSMSQSTVIPMNTSPTLPQIPMRTGSPPIGIGHHTSWPGNHFPIPPMHTVGTSPYRMSHRPSLRNSFNVLDDTRRFSLAQRSTSSGSLLYSTVPTNAIPMSPTRSSFKYYAPRSPTLPYHHTASLIDPDVPTHMLQPISSADEQTPEPSVAANPQPLATHLLNDSSDEQESSSDDMDLLGIVKKKTRQRQKELYASGDMA